jgi:hypothetical protein
MFQSFFLHPQQITDHWSKALRQQLERFEAMSTEADRVHGQGLERAHQAIDETAKLMKDSLDYAGQLGTEWRKWWLGAVKQTTDLANPGA